MYPNIFKNKKLLLLVGVVLIVVLVYSAMQSTTRQGVDTGNTTSEPIDFSKITSGTTTREEVINNFSSPTAIITIDGYDAFEYKSKSPTRNDLILFSDEKVGLAKEIVTLNDDENVEDMYELYGTTSDFLYGPDSPAGFLLYVYASQGVAFIGNVESGHLLEIWYFTPTTFDDFREKWARDYSDEQLHLQ